MASVENVPQQPEQDQDVLKQQPELQEDPQSDQQKEQLPSAMKKWQSEGGLDDARRKASVNDNCDADAKDSQAPSGYRLRKRKSGGEVTMTTTMKTTTKTKKAANDDNVKAEKGLIIKRGRRSGGRVKKVPTDGEVIEDMGSKAGEEEGSKEEDAAKFLYTAMDEEDLAPARHFVTDAAPTSVNLIREEPAVKTDDHAEKVEDDDQKKKSEDDGGMKDGDDDDVGKQNDDGDQGASGGSTTDAGSIEAGDEANAGQTTKEEEDDTLTEENADTSEATE